MGRTYRLRHEQSLIARKFTDGNVEKYHLVQSDRWAALTVHGIYGYPCETVDGDGGAAGRHFSCCFFQFIRPWHMRRDAVRQLAGDRPLTIAPMYCHEYAKPGRKAKKMTRYGENSVRQKVRRALTSAARNGNFEDDWDTRLHDKPWFKYER